MYQWNTQNDIVSAISIYYLQNVKFVHSGRHVKKCWCQVVTEGRIATIAWITKKSNQVVEKIVFPHFNDFKKSWIWEVWCFWAPGDPYTTLNVLEKELRFFASSDVTVDSKHCFGKFKLVIGDARLLRLKNVWTIFFAKHCKISVPWSMIPRVFLNGQNNWLLLMTLFITKNITPESVRQKLIAVWFWQKLVDDLWVCDFLTAFDIAQKCKLVRAIHLIS